MNTTIKKISIISLTILLSTALLINPVEANSSKLQQRLDDLSNQLEQQRIDFHIPGMAIAIVKDNKVILTEGFGVSNLKTNKPVTKQTLFGIGSTTKAFTANLIGMLVDEGKMKWDDPITKYLPYFKFNMENEDSVISLRDMMSHQTGFTRFNLLYVNGKVSRDEILHAATKAEPWAGFREKFLYTNLMVTAAGVAAAHSIDSTWEKLLESRLLKPLGMSDTTAHHKIAQQNPLLSTGYMWLEEQEKHKQLTMHDITNIGPAGAINSNVQDMAKWLRLQLGKGKFNGEQIISTSQINETWSPQIKVSSSASYGLGWMLREYKGQKLVAHDGSVEGYSAIVALLPDSNIGFVLLTNVTQTGLLGTAMNMVFETLLDEAAPKIASEKFNASSYTEFVGDYIANFATFSDTIFNFHLKDGTPYVDVPGQTDYELKAPDKDGKMYFSVTDTVSISFDKDKQGNIVAMRMQQGGMNFEIPKKGAIIKPEINEEELTRYLGKYYSELFKAELTVKIQNHRLTVDVPGQMAFELHIPDEKGHRHFRIKSVMSVRFETNDNNMVSAISLYEADKKLDTAKRVASLDNNKLPTVADILKLRKAKKRIKALKKSNGFLIKGKVQMKQSGVQATVTTSFSGYDNFREEVDFGQYGSIITTLNDKNAAIAPSFSAFMEQHGKYYEQTLKLHPASLIDWEHYYENIKVIAEEQSKEKFNNKKIIIVKLSGGETPAATVTIDAENGDILKIKSNILNPTMGSIPVTRIFENYKTVHGIRFAHKVTVKNEFNGESIIIVGSIEKNQNFNPSIFNQNNPQTGEQHDKSK